MLQIEEHTDTTTSGEGKILQWRVAICENTLFLHDLLLG